MELQAIHNNVNGVDNSVHTEVKFIEANTQPVTIEEIRSKHIIPVFVKDNTPTISQADFISTAVDVVEEVSGKLTTHPAVRVSHPIKGRIFEARNKKANELLDYEKTIYYERMAFICEIPEIKETIHGRELTLSFGGVKAYNQDNLYNTGDSNQRFKFFIGFKVKVCTNLCIWTDGYSGELKVRSLEELANGIYEVVNRYDSDRQLNLLERFGRYELTEQQFATLVGRARLYQHLPKYIKKEIPELLVSDSQVSSVTRAYYKDEHFKSLADGSINLWHLYNLFTGSVKSSYIDSFLDRNVNAFSLTDGISNALEGRGEYRWFLDGR